jgi:ribosomal protein S6
MGKDGRRRYGITVIFDTRERDESPDDMRGRIGHTMETLGATVETAEDLGTRDFARRANRRFISGAYARYVVSASPSFGAELDGRLRLDKTVNRALIECI